MVGAKANINKALSSSSSKFSLKKSSSVFNMNSRSFFSPVEREVFSTTALKEFISSGPLEARDIIAYLNQYFCYVQDPRQIGKNVVVSVWDHEKGFVFLHKSKKEAEDLLVPYKITLPVTEMVKGKRVSKSKPFPIFPLWFNSPERRTRRGFTFDPELAPSIHPDTKFINLWRGYDCYASFGELEVTDKTKHNYGLIKHHFEEVMYRGEEVLYTYAEKWLAHRVQFPHICPGVALLLTGPQGSGKTQFFKFFSQLLHPHAEYVMRSELLTGKYAGYVTDNMVFICCDEVDFTDKKVMNYVKTMVDGHKRHSEVKFGAVNQPKNFLSFAFTSNDPYCLSAEVGSEMRRWFHVQCDGSMVGNNEYFTKLTLAFEEEDGAAMKLYFQHLCNTDLTDFNIRDRPITEELRSQQMSKLSDFDDWWLGCIRRGYHIADYTNGTMAMEWKKDDVFVETLYGEFISNNQRRKATDCSNLAAFIEKLKQVLPYAEGLSIENKKFEMPPYEECEKYAKFYYKLPDDQGGNQSKVVSNQNKKRKTVDQRKLEDQNKKRRLEARAKKAVDCQTIRTFFSSNGASRQVDSRQQHVENAKGKEPDEGEDIGVGSSSDHQLVSLQNGTSPFHRRDEEDSQAGFFYDPQGVPYLEDEEDDIMANGLY